MNSQEIGVPTPQRSMSTLLSLLPSSVQPGSSLQILGRMSECCGGKEAMGKEGTRHHIPKGGALLPEQPWAIPTPEHSHPSCPNQAGLSPGE